MLMSEKIERSREHATLALDAYLSTGGQDDDDTVAIGDLIADLLHLAEDRGALPSEMTDYAMRALNHYEYESDPDNANDAV